MTRDSKIQTPDLDWGENDKSPFSPRSVDFDDIYFSGDGPAETSHVFLAGNRLPERWNSAHNFTIGELGFGTGLNLLCAWDLWRRTEKPAGAHLNCVSVEAFPLSAAEMEKAHAAWPALAPLSARLRAALPARHPGIHQCVLGDNVTLTLIYGEAKTGLAAIEATIDAWFFDGFSPAKNPDMWSDAVFAQCAHLSRAETTFATFTVAGSVRRALESNGFSWQKETGFGRKRDMLIGHYEPAPDARSSQATISPSRAPWFAHAEGDKRPEKIAIIGGGIAGASLCHALKQKGFTPTIFEKADIASGASGNPAGLIMPRLDLGDTPSAVFFASAYLHILRVISEIADNKIFAPCGVLHHALSDKDKERHERLIAQSALPDGYIAQRSDGLFYPQGGTVNPAGYARMLLGDAQIIRDAIVRLVHRDGCWTLTGQNEQYRADCVIIANAMDALRFEQARSLPLSGSAGQIDYFKDASPPDCAHAFGPYCAPAPGGGAIIGATYAPISIGAEARFTPEATASNVDAVARIMPDFAASLIAAKSSPRASIRCTTPDRLPIVGPMPDWGFYSGAYDGLRTGKRGTYPEAQCHPGLFILTGLGSRGLVTAPLCAEMIAAEIAGAPAPVPPAVAEAVHPARFFIRDLKRTKS